MINNYLKTGFPVYDNIRKQFRFRSGEGAQNCIYNHYTSSNALLPFQIRKVKSDTDFIISWSVKNLDGSNSFNLNQNINIFIKNIDNSFENWIYDGRELVFRYNNGIVAPLEMCNGMFYSVIEFQSGQKYYSEVFTIDSKQNLNELIKIEWLGGCLIAGISYVDNFRNLVFINGEIQKSIPAINEEGEEIEGKFIPTIVRYTNRYRISLITPDWLVETLTMACIHPKITITTNDGLYTADVQNLKVENLEWLDPPCYARIDLTFEQEEGALYTNCCG